MAKTAKKSILSNARALDGIVEPLLLWFYGEKRSLPWRRRANTVSRMDFGNHASTDSSRSRKALFFTFH